MKYVLMTGHDAVAPKDVKAFDTYAEAAVAAHEFFESYGFQLIDGVVCDEGGEPMEPDDMEDLEIVDGKVVQFMHAGGDGPVCEIKKG